MCCVVLLLITQSYLTLCNTLDCSLPGSSVHDFPGKNTGVGMKIQGIFLIQELNQGLLCCSWILYQLSYQGSLKVNVKTINFIDNTYKSCYFRCFR